jgi:hypothetical protein
VTEDQEFHRDRRYHGGAPQRLDDDKLAEETEDERVDAGLDAYNPDEVPPATDPLPPGTPEPKPDIRDTPEYREELREAAAERPDAEGFPPTRYEDE